jgi:hypothetical protein
MEESPAPTHDVANLLEVGDLVRRQPDLSSSGNSLPLLDIGRHSVSFARPQCRPVAGFRNSLVLESLLEWIWILLIAYGDLCGGVLSHNFVQVSSV